MISRDRAEDDARLDALTERLGGTLQRRTGSAETAEDADA
jgi:DNA-directed RNA polymerase specialized sigma24 family protein